MKYFGIIAIVIAVLAAACSGNVKHNNGIVDEQTNVAEVDLQGQWYLENIVFNDSDFVRPSEEVPGSRQYIIFEDSTYSVMTNCNAMTGSYAVKGDSIWLSDGAMTELACDNMVTENALRRIFPNIFRVDIENDSIVRLNGSVATEYIVLRKATEIK